MRLLPNVIKAFQYTCLKEAVAILPSPGCATMVAERRDTAVDQRKRILDEAAEEAKKIIESAKLYGEKIVQDKRQQWEEESEKVRSKAEREGYQAGLEKGSSEGYRAGYRQGEKEAKDAQQQVLDDMKSLLEDMETQKGDILEKYASDIQTLAFEIAEKIIPIEIDSNEKALAAVIENATEAYRRQAWIKLTIPKGLEKWVSEDGNRIDKALREVSDNVKIVVSPEMEDGGCQIDMPEQMIDAGTGTQLSRVKAALQL